MAGINLSIPSIQPSFSDYKTKLLFRSHSKTITWLFWVKGRQVSKPVTPC